MIYPHILSHILKIFFIAKKFIWGEIFFTLQRYKSYMDFQNNTRAVSFQEPFLIGQSLSLTWEGGSDLAEHVAPSYGNHIEKHGCVAEVRDRPLVALYLICRDHIPFSAVALRVGNYLLHKSLLVWLLLFSFVSRLHRSVALAVQRYAVEHSQSEPYFQWLVCFVVDYLA